MSDKSEKCIYFNVVSVRFIYINFFRVQSENDEKAVC